MRRGRMAAVVAALVGAAFVGGMGLGEQRGRQRESTPAAEVAPGGSGSTADASDASATARDEATPTPAAATATWPPLPAPDAAVAQVFDELADRAKRGDTAAACRLASDLQRCAKTLSQRELASNLQDQAARYEQTPAGMVDYIANLERRQESIGDRCDGLQSAQLAQAFDFQRQAALAQPELRVWFALNPALERRDFVTELERWAEYRRLAMPWLEAAAREGDPAALIALARVHGDLRRNSPPWPPFRIDDPVRAFAYNDALLRLGAQYRGLRIGAANARARLDAEAQARATELADALVETGAAHADSAAIAVAMDRTFEPLPASGECEPGS